ncbi:MAG TPA: hypothetical protein VFC96_01005 [Anaerovoracaceae bacterium]|nr:hypothetical protein [Anaerovoracaceae bacterium]
MIKMMKRFLTFIISTLCLTFLLPFAAMANQLPAINDYNNFPEGYQAMGTQNEELTAKGSYSYLLAINEKVRNIESEEYEYTRNIFYDFTNLPENSYFHSSNRQDFDNGYIYQSPGVVMHFRYTDKITGPDDFLNQYKLITDEEYRNKEAASIPDSIKLDTIGKYRAVHATISYEDVEGYLQNDHYFIPLPTPIPHYGTAYLLLIVSNDVQVKGDLKVDELPEIYDQWLTECLETTEGWVNEIMNFNYTVRADEYVEGPLSDAWPKSNDEPSPIEDPAPEASPEQSNEPQTDEDKTPVEEPEANEDNKPGKEQESEKEPTKNDKDNKKADNADEDNDSEDSSDGYADPVDAAIITIISILISILFGGTGGYVPATPVGTGGTPASSPSGNDLGKWLHFDDEGDIEATDPISGEKRNFVHNGDGTYTDPISGATYTPEELSQQMKHREKNAQTIRQDEKQFKKNVDEDSKRNEELSNESKILEEELRREREERAHREKVERVATNLGMSGASEDDVKKELARRMERDEEFRQKMHDYAKRRDMAVDTLEKTVEIADYAMSAGESLGGAAGKAVSATYKGVKNTVSTVAEKGLSTGSVIEGVIKGGTEAATTVMNSGIAKAGVTIGGTVAGEVASAVNDGTDIGDAIKEGLITGSGNAAIGAVGDAIGEAVEGEGLLNKAAETAEKLAETAYGKEIVEPMYDDLTNKDD